MYNKGKWVFFNENFNPEPKGGNAVCKLGEAPATTTTTTTMALYTVQMDKGSCDKCPQGYSKILFSQADCKKAAEVVNKKPYKGSKFAQKRNNRPAGCYSKGKWVFFNKDKNPKSCGGSLSVCRLGPARAQFAIGDGMKCPDDYSKISDQTQCKTAAKGLKKKPYKGKKFAQKRSNRPPGCYNKGKWVFYNTNKRPSKSGGSHAVCELKSFLFTELGAVSAPRASPPFLRRRILP